MITILFAFEMIMNASQGRVVLAEALRCAPKPESETLEMNIVQKNGQHWYFLTKSKQYRYIPQYRIEALLPSMGPRDFISLLGPTSVPTQYWTDLGSGGRGLLREGFYWTVITNANDGSFELLEATLCYRGGRQIEFSLKRHACWLRSVSSKWPHR